MIKTKISLLLGALTSSMAIAQVGVGTEHPNKGFEVEGSVRFRNLEEGDLNVFTREVLLDDAGNIGYLEIERERSYFVKMVFDEMEQEVVMKNTDKSTDLFLDVEVELLPHSISVFEINYNVPFYLKTIQDPDPNLYFMELPEVDEVGVRLMKQEIGKDSDYVNVKEGNRILTIVSGFEKSYPQLALRSSFVEGMTIQEVVNNDAVLKKVKYKLMTYSKNNDGTVQFGSNKENDLGVGTISVKVYHKPYYVK